MRHRAFLAVDGPSRTSFLDTMGGPRHRWAPDERKYVRTTCREEVTFMRWCDAHELDPADTASIVAYEGDIGWLYLDDPPEDHR
jgi:hypothetical protein